MSSAQTYDPVVRMRELIENAVASSGEELETLAAWLARQQLPLLPGNDEPFQWLLRGLDDFDDPGEARTELTRWAASLLDDEPEARAKREEEGPRFLYNLLMLATALASSEWLAEPLRRILDRRTLDGEYEGIVLRAAFRDALAANQPDAALESLWSAMATGTLYDSFVPGTTFHGFQGLLLMPDPERGLGHPALQSICAVLPRQIEALEQAWDKKRELFGVFDQLLDRYRSHDEIICTTLLRAAEDQEWPGWAAEALPNLFLHAHRSPEPNCYLVWVGYLRRFETIQEKEGEELFYSPMPSEEIAKRKVFVPISLTPQGDRWRHVFAALEESRREQIELQPNLTGRAFHAVLADCMTELELEMKYGQQEGAETVLETRGELLVEMAVPV